MYEHHTSGLWVSMTRQLTSISWSSDYSPAVKKGGLYWICLVLPEFCHSVIIQMKLEYLLRPVGQCWSNFIWSIIRVGERLHKVLGQIGLKLWFEFQLDWISHFGVTCPCGWIKFSIGILWCLHLFSVVFDPILLILAGNEDMHKISEEFVFQPDWTTDYGVSCPSAS